MELLTFIQIMYIHTNVRYMHVCIMTCWP